MTNDEYDAQIRAMLKPIEVQPDVERAERIAEAIDRLAAAKNNLERAEIVMALLNNNRQDTNEQRDIDTYTRIDYSIRLLEYGSPLSMRERREVALLLRRLRKEKYGSALTDAERREGRSEINP